jgi:hypothetical protein
MAEFVSEDLDRARFEGVRLRRAVFHDVDLSQATFRLVDLTGVMIRGAALRDVEIDGLLDNVVINGVDVVPLIEAELDRRDPDRAKIRPTTAAGFAEAWKIVTERWQRTLDRAWRLPPSLLHERVRDEWSFIETQRHLVFATDAWVVRAILGRPHPWDSLDLPHDDMPEIPGVPRDRNVRPSLDEVLELRRDRMATVQRVIDDLTDERLQERTTPVTEPGYPESDSFLVADCLRTVLDEEWQHRVYAERDLSVLESGDNVVSD